MRDFSRVRHPVRPGERVALRTSIQENDPPRLQTARTQRLGKYSGGQRIGRGSDHPERRKIQKPGDQL